MNWLKKALDWMYEEPRIGGQYVDYKPHADTNLETKEILDNRETTISQKTKLLKSESQIVGERDISEPVFAIGKATLDKLNRWKFYTRGLGYVIVEDKYTGRDWYIRTSNEGIEYQPYGAYDISSYIFQLIRLGGDEEFIHEKLIPLTTVKIESYLNVFNGKEIIYLEKCFLQLINRKLEQARRVYDYRIYKAELSKIEGQRKSIRAGLETREKLLQEYCK